MFSYFFFLDEQLKGLHCWLCYVRLRVEPREQRVHIFHEMMELLWEQMVRDLTKEEGLGQTAPPRPP